ncbi:MAG: DUF3604 domain-containing protein [Anaerolineae bacterium]
MTDQTYHNLNVFYGDIHSHCDLSYGHGSLADALQNARLQLDFVSIIVHAVWPDLPVDDPTLNYLIDYHERGFARAQANWAGYLRDIEQANSEGEFITFPGFEWHSMEYGDYCIHYQQVQDNLPIIDAPDLASLRARLRDISCPTFLIPHHIGYRQGSRGINWRTFTDEMSPVAEIFSFHGLAESSEGPYPYLHSMGPRHEQSTAQFGWEQGNVFGIVGSTDHHNAFPGSYGYGRMGVWAESCSREAIWNAILNRRTYALTGDKIDLRFELNDACMGSICPPDDTREITVDIRAGDSIDYIDVLHNNRIIHRENVLPRLIREGYFKIYIEMGWGEQSEAYAWDVSVTISNGTLHDVEPHFRGIEPTANDPDQDFAYSTLEHTHNHIHLQTKTYPNPSLHTAGTEGVVLEIEGTPETLFQMTFNGHTQEVCLDDILTGARTFYTGGFVSPAVCLHRAVPQSEYHHQFTLTHQQETNERDWYYVRVRQRNNQWAWSSPIWIEGTSK